MVGRSLLLWNLLPFWLDRSFTDGRSLTNLTGNASQGQKCFESAALNSERNALNETALSTFSKCVGLNDEPGFCEYFKQCFPHEYRSNFTLAINHACTIEKTYIGVCCANRRTGMREKYLDEQNFAETLPLIAVDDTNDTNVEQRNATSGTGGSASRIVWTEDESVSTFKPKNPAKSKGCGTTWKNGSRLVDGRPADPAEWPWMAAILRREQVQYCGGVLITDRHVLTAAHCVYSLKSRDIKVRLGEYDFAVSEETRIFDFPVSEILVHRDFDFTTYENDIAMIKMHRPTVFDNYIWPVCLPPIDQTFENKSAIVIGWGTRYYGGPASTVLMEVGVPIWPRNKCADSFVQRIPNTMMCAGAYEGGRDACQGDSGGPLLHQLGNGRWVNVGIVSWGIQCGEPGFPGIYTRVSSYLDWIFENAVF